MIIDKNIVKDSCLDWKESGLALGNYENYDVCANGLADVIETFKDSEILISTLGTANMFKPSIHTACP